MPYTIQDGATTFSNGVLLHIINKGVAMQPITNGTIEYTTERQGTPGKLTFKVLKDEYLDFQEGNEVRLSVNGKYVFKGYVFKKSRDKEQNISVTAYDQLRYLKNKITHVYKGETAGALVKKLAKEFNLIAGEIEDTKYKIPERVEDNKTLFDIIQYALDETLKNTKQLYVLYDEFGHLSLKNIGHLKLDLLIDGDTACNFQYDTDIDSETYNCIKLYYDDNEAGSRNTYVTKDSDHINQWGLLQYTEKLNDEANGKVKADALLELYNTKTRKLSVKDCLGDTRVRAGRMVAIKLELGDINVFNYMLVEKCTHKFSNCEHTMDLTLSGGTQKGVYFSAGSIGTSGGSSNSQNSSSASGGTSSGGTSTGGRSDIVNYAKQFLGGKYVYGGTSITNGIDCSGFTQYVMRHFGKSIPRNSAAQYASAGVKVSKSDLQPGDLMFYGYNGKVSHVAIYAGNGRIVHASDEKSGICMGNAFPTKGKQWIGAKRV